MSNRFGDIIEENSGSTVHKTLGELSHQPVSIQSA